MTDSAPPIAAPTAATPGRLRRFDLLWIAAIYVLGQASVVLASLLAGLAYRFVLHRPIDIEALSRGDVAQGAIVAAIVLAAVVFFLGSLWLARRRGFDRRSFGFAAAVPRWYLAAGAIFVLFFLLDSAIFHFLDPTGALEDDLTSKLFLATGSLGWAFAVALAAGPITALAEETLFRGLVYRWFRERWGVASGIATSGIIFGLSHFYFIIPGGLAGAALTGEIMIMGFLTAWLFQASGSLWPPILLHLLNNSSVVLIAFLAPAAGGS
jgi:CAAX protease family protein